MNEGRGEVRARSAGRVRRRSGRRIALALVGVSILVLGLAQALRSARERGAARAAFPVVSGSLPLPGLEAVVVVHRDARGLPHIDARSEADGWRALGFVHAQDRLGQMLWLRQQAWGRTAEVLGAEGLSADRLARLIDFAGLARRQLPVLRPEARRALEAYAAGVEAYIERVRSGQAGAPLVVRQLRLALDPWSAEDSLALFKLYAWGLSASIDASLVLSDVIEQLGAVAARPYFPNPDSADPPPASRVTTRALPPGGEFHVDPLRRALGLESRSVGSSAWAISGRHTESGRPILVADAHLPTSAPAYLHLDRLRAGDLQLVGATLPGVPVFWSGRSRSVAWASVQAPAVVTDLYVETLDPGDASRYHDGQRWRSLPERVETLRVRGGPDEELRVHRTRHGPLLPRRASPQPLSVAWVGARVEGPSGIGSLLDVARAENAAQVVEALRVHHEPALIMVYADAEGAGGLQMAGWIPDRTLSPQLLPLPGRARWYDWNSPVPFEALPSARLDARRGWVVAADDRLRSPDEEVSIEWLWRSGERAARIERLLTETVGAGPVDLRRATEIQTDVGNARALDLVRSALSLGVASDGVGFSPEAQELTEILARWDGSTHADSVGASAYHVFLRSLTEALLEERLGEPLMRRYLALPQTDPERLVYEIVRHSARGGRGVPEQERERVVRAVRESLREGWLQLSFELGANRRRWSWGRLHSLRFRSFGGLDAVLGDLEDLGPYPYGGDASTVNAGAYDPSRPFDVRVASTLRLAVDTASPDQTLAALAPGQSEHPGHPNHGDAISDWLKGRSSLVVSGRLLVEDSSVARLLLEPVP
jgi:penicillin amidase